MHTEVTLRSCLGSLSRVAYSGVVTRLVDFDAYSATSTPRLLFDEGPRLYGQRYTPINGPKAIYGAEGADLAEAEFAGKGISAVRPTRGATRIQLHLEVTLQAVLDLGDPRVRRQVATSLEELRGPWRGVLDLTGVMPPTWALGNAVYESERFEAIRYPSAQVERRYCLVIFTEHLAKGSSIRAVGQSQDLETIAGSFILKP
ncbi:MAG: RES family NAD+ phosphorylase [Verrucomicrobiales bacterium]|nr:RES family NAD+ phosphorylase [Verrucomicrobiales bacterium]